MDRAANSLMSVSRFLQQVQKQAGTYEPGSVGGETSHVSKNVDSQTFPLREGEHSEENNKDVKDQVGTPAIIGEGKKKEAVDSIPTPNLREAPTGEDPENEKPKKTTKDDNAGTRLGRTTHPARADNPGLDKIAFDDLPLAEHYKVATDLGNQVLAMISVSADFRAPEPEATQASKQAADAAAVDQAGQLGWELAGVVDQGFDKQAMTAYINQSAYNLVKTGNDDGDNVVEYLVAYHASQEKAAAEAAQAQAQKPAQRKQAMAMPPGAGGPPMGAEGPPPGAGAEGPPPGAEGGAGGGEEELMAMLEQIAQQQGVSVEELIAQLMDSGAGGEGGPEASPPPPGADPGMEVAASVKTAAAQQKAAAPKKASSAEATRAYVQELLNRSKV